MRGALVSEATALPTEPQPLPAKCFPATFFVQRLVLLTAVACYLRHYLLQSFEIGKSVELIKLDTALGMMKRLVSLRNLK